MREPHPGSAFFSRCAFLLGKAPRKRVRVSICCADFMSVLLRSGGKCGFKNAAFSRVREVRFRGRLLQNFNFPKSKACRRPSQRLELEVAATPKKRTKTPLKYEYTSLAGKEHPAGSLSEPEEKKNATCENVSSASERETKAARALEAAALERGSLEEDKEARPLAREATVECTYVPRAFHEVQGKALLPRL